MITDPQTVISDDVGSSFQWPWFAAGSQPTPPGSVTFDGRALVHLNTPTLGDTYYLYSELSPRSPQGEWVKWRFLWSIDRVTGYAFNDWITIASIQDQTTGSWDFIPLVAVRPAAGGLKFSHQTTIDGGGSSSHFDLGAPIVANQTYDIELWLNVTASTVSTKLIVDGNLLSEESLPNSGTTTVLGARWVVFGFDGTAPTSTPPPTMAYDDLRYVVGGSPTPGPVAGAPPPEATYGPCDQGSRWQNVESVQAACRARANDPVTLSTGAVSSSMTDASMGSIGEQFKFTRSYTSLDTNTGELGVGWTDNYSDKLTVNSGIATWRSGSGAQVVFTQQADGSWKAPPWTSVTLTSSGGNYEAVTPNQTHYLFDSQGRLTAVKDRNGQGVTLTYNGQGQRATLTDASGHTVTFDHNADGTLSKLTLPDGRFVQYAYTNGHLTTVTDLRGNPYTYGYDTSGRLESETDQNTHRLVFNVYGPDGRISQQTDANNNTTQFAWDAATQTATVTDARQHQWKSVFSGTLLLSQTDPFGNKVRYGYEDSTGDLVQYIDALGHVEQMTYDSRHNMLTRTAPTPLSYNEVWTYNQFNDPLTYTDGRGNETDYTYDTAGNLKTVQGPDPDGAGPLGRPLTTYTLDPAGTGLVTAVQDPRLKTTQYGYDPTTHLRTSTTTPMSEVTTFTYDATGRLATSVEPRGNVTGCNCASQYTTTYEYDNADHLKKITSPDPDGAGSQLAFSKQWLYDPGGNLETYTDENGNATDYGYDNGNRLTSVTAPDPDGAGPLQRPVTSYTYDEVGNLKTRTVAGTHTTTYSYDDANRLASVSSPTGQLWTYGYDANGNRTSQVDANGNATQTAGDGTTTYGYDELGRLKSISYSDTTPAVAYQYDANDNLTQMTDGSGTETRTYDTVNELTNVTRGSNAFTYVYDIAGNLAQTTYPDSTVVTAGYDNDERLSSVASGGATTSYGYDPASNLTTTTLPSGNGFVETRTYDRAGRLTEVKNSKGSTTLSDMTYTLDSAGNPTKAVRTGGLSETTTYTYDNLNRIMSVCYQLTCPNGSDPFVKWTYDSVGNRLSEQRPSGTKNYTYNNADQLTQVGTTAYTYDKNGNEKTAGSTTFSYDLANRLISTTSGSTTTTYTYDGLNKRLQASTGSQANKKTNFLWDINSGLPQVALERDGNNGLLRRYVNGAKRISMTSGNNTYYFHYDPLGSITNMTSSAGATEWTDSYEPYGPVRTEVKNDSHGAPTTFMKYTGEYLDPTGLYHLRARQYDPSTGRFLTLDPLPNPVQTPYMSAYAYASDAPTVMVDPLGLRSGTCGSWRCFLSSRPHAIAQRLREVHDAGDLLALFSQYVEEPILAVGFTAGGVAVATVCSGATAAVAPFAGPAACVLAGGTITTIGIGYGYAVYHQGRYGH